MAPRSITVLGITAFVGACNLLAWRSSTRFSTTTTTAAGLPTSRAVSFLSKHVHPPPSSRRRGLVPQADATTTTTTDSTPGNEAVVLSFLFPEPQEPPKEPAKKLVEVPILLAWTIFLLAFLGICAGDFLVANLATISDALGLSDATAGVTLLALGNGSPDVFSTYASFRADSGSLAIGELLGAAAFIVSVVVGSMALVKPFKVHSGPFIRDVSFAIVAVALLLIVLHDGSLHLYEAIAMIGLYGCYVAWVIGGAWFLRHRQEKFKAKRRGRDEIEAGATQEGEMEPPFSPGDGRSYMSGSRSKRNSLAPPMVSPPATVIPLARSHSDASTSTCSLLHPADAFPAPQTEQQALRPDHHLRSSSLAAVPRVDGRSSPRGRRPRSNSAVDQLDVRRSIFSLLGAVEFRDVVNSLRAEGDDFSQFDVPASPYASGHYHQHSHHRHSSYSSSHLHHHSHTTTPRLAGSQLSSYARSGGRSRPGSTRSNPSAPLTPSVNNLASFPFNSGVSRPASLYMPTGPSLSGEGELTPTGPPAGLDAERNPWSDSFASAASERSESTIHAPGPRASISTQGELSVCPSSSGPHEPVRTNSLPHDITVVLPTPPTVRDGPERSNSPIHLFRSNPHSNYKRRKLLHLFRVTCHTLFPSLQSFRHKSLVGKLLSILAVPAILALTLTLPVVDNQADGCGSSLVYPEKDDEGQIRLSDDSEDDGYSDENEADRFGPYWDEEQEPYRDEPPSRDNGILDHSNDPHGWESAPHNHVAAHCSSSSAPTTSITDRIGGTMHARLIDVGESPGRVQDTLSEYQHAASHCPHQLREQRAEEQESETSLLEDEMWCDREKEEDVTHVLQFNKWLVATQCVLGPVFCAAVLFWDSGDMLTWPSIVICALGLVAGFAVVVVARDGQNSFWRIARCMLGFSVAMVWIMVLADEIVTVLTVLGELFGLSDAIIGLTIFAIGNSTADFVANLSIASFAPIMAFSACFGGPMLNILLGVGLSGAFVTITTGKPYLIRFSPTLLASGSGLLLILVATLIFVPFNSFLISRRWGLFLIGLYLASMIANILTEIYLE